MKKKYQNIFFIFGLVVLAVMVSQLHFVEVWQGPATRRLLVLRRRGPLGLSLPFQYGCLVHHHPQRRATRRRKRDARESRASRSSRESRNSRETRESRNSRDSRVPRESRDARGVRNARGLLVALQDHRLRLCPQLRHARRLDGLTASWSSSLRSARSAPRPQYCST